MAHYLLQENDFKILLEDGSGAILLENSPLVEPPTAQTYAANPITSDYANANGNITSAGEAPITERGFVWSTSVNPTILDNKIIITGTTGPFAGSMTSLTTLTTYHYRAYATNSGGTSYGDDITFTTTSVAIGKLAKIIKLKDRSPYSLLNCKICHRKINAEHSGFTLCDECNKSSKVQTQTKKDETKSLVAKTLASLRTIPDRRTITKVPVKVETKLKAVYGKYVGDTLHIRIEK